VDVLRTLFRRSALSNEGDRATLLANPDALEWPEAAIAEGRTQVAVDEVGRIVGFATVFEVADYVDLEDLFVEPERKRQGIGRELVRDVVASATSRGFERLEVTANHHALAFYEEMGFVFECEVETRFGVAPRMSLSVKEEPHP